MRVRVDLELCQGNGVCVEEAPEVFDTEERPGRYPRVRLRREQPEESLRARVERAVRHCPTRALSIVDD